MAKQAAVQKDASRDDPVAALSQKTTPTEKLIVPAGLSIRASNRLLAERYLYDFGRQAWRIVEPETPFLDNWHIGECCEVLQAMSTGEVKRLIINVPPRFMKSLLSMVFLPAWTWIHWPASRWITSSYAQDLAIRDAVKSRDIILSPWYQHNWGDRYELKVDQNVKSRYSNNWAGLRYSAAVRSAVTGEGGDFLGIDDPINVRDAPSKLVRDRVNEWWDQVMSTRLNNPKRGRKYVIMQRTNEDDLTGHILQELATDYVHFFIPMRFEEGRVCTISLPPYEDMDDDGNAIECEGYQYTDPRSVEGELAAPNRFGEPQVVELETSLSYQAAGQLQQRPTAAEGDIFKSQDFGYFDWIDDIASHQPHFLDDESVKSLDGMADDLAERQKELADSPRSALAAILTLVNPQGNARRFFANDLVWVQVVDTALKEKQSADYTASGILGFTPQHDLVCLDLIMERIRVPKQFGFVTGHRRRFSFTEDTYVEDKQSGTGLIQQAADEGCPFRTLKADTDKVRRAGPLATLCQNGKVFFPAGNPHWLGPVIDQLLTFPNGLHDDAVDVLAYGSRLMLEQRTSMPRIRSFDDDLDEDEQKKLQAALANL